MNLRRLYWFTVFVPLLFLLLLELARHVLLERFVSSPLAALLALALLIPGIALFARTVFRILDRMQRDLSQRNRELAALNAIGGVVSLSLDPREFLPSTLDKVLELTGLEAAGMCLLEPQSGDTVLIAHRGAFAQSFAQRCSSREGDSFPGLVARSGEPLVTEDLLQDERFQVGAVQEQELRFFACIPCKSRGEVLGVMCLASHQPRQLSDQDRELLVSIGNQIGVALENARLHEKVRDLAVLEERDRLAREMHDGLAQVLGYLNLKIDTAHSLLSSEKVEQTHEELEKMRDAVGNAYADVRETILGLKVANLSQSGLVPSIQEYLERWNEQSEVKAELVMANGDSGRLDLGTEIQLIRIVEEALTNVRKHSGASRAWIRFELDGDRVRLAVEDNGCGFDPSGIRRRGQHFGLHIMRERAQSLGGSITVKSELGRGTTVVVTVPRNERGRRWNG